MPAHIERFDHGPNKCSQEVTKAGTVRSKPHRLGTGVYSLVFQEKLRHPPSGSSSGKNAIQRCTVVFSEECSFVSVLGPGSRGILEPRFVRGFLGQRELRVFK